MGLLDLRLKKYIYHYSFLESELAETQHMFDEFNKQFKLDFRDAIAGAIQQHSHTIKQDVNQEPHDSSGPGMNLLNKIFRKIALKVHPDKSGTQFAGLFCKLEEHYRDQDVLKLMLLAAETDTKIDGILPEDFIAFDTNLTKLQDKIEKIKGSLAWTWCTAADEQKQALRASMLNLIQADN